MNIVNVGYLSCNYYLIEQNRKGLLIDVGWPGTLPKLSAGLRRKGMVLEDLGYLCITHYHPDHAGLVQELKNKGVRHIVLEQQLPALSRLKTYMQSHLGYVDIRLQDSLILETSESRAWMESLGLSGEILSTPGHSDDSISLVLDEGIAFTGDLVPSEMLEGNDAAAAERSWAKLRGLNVRTVYPGHGPDRKMPGSSPGNKEY